MCAAVALLCSCSANKIPAPELIKPVDAVGSTAQAPAMAEAAKRDAQDQLKAAIRLKEEGRVSEAATVLKDLRAENGGTVWAKRASFLLGVYPLGPQAHAYLEEAASIDDIRDYALYYLAGSFRNVKDYRKAASYYDTLIKDYPGSALLPAALFEKAAALDESGDSTAARAALKDFMRMYPGHKLTPDALFRIAQYSIKTGDQSGALAPLKRILVEYPAHPAAQDARISLQKIRLGPTIVPAYTMEERGQRAQRLFDAGRYSDALAEFTYIARHGGHEQKSDASVMAVLTLTRLKNYEKAQKAAMDYLSSKNSGACRKEPEALYLLSLASLRRGDSETLVKTEKKLIEKYPLRKETAEAIFLAGRAYEDAGETEKAMAAYRRVSEGYSGAMAAMNSYWRLGWINYTSGRYDEALKSFSAYLQSPGTVKNADQFIYWRARTLERLGRALEADDEYSRACREFPFSYYCRMAQERIAGLGPDKTADSNDDTNDSGDSVDDEDEGTGGEASSDSAVAAEVPSGAQDGAIEARKELSADRHYRAAIELTSLGLADMAGPELDLLFDKYKDDIPALVELAGLYYDCGDYYRALRSFKRFYAVSGALSLPAQMQKAAYPQGVIDRIEKTVDPGYADPYLVASIMREESAFNPKAVSWAGAMGLMQIMPRTAELIAKELGADYGGSSELFTPELNTRFGAWYLGSLSKKFNNDIVLTIAGYNAGPIAAAKWSGQRPMDADEFIENIPYQETRNYVKRVLNSYSRFLRLKGSELVLTKNKGPERQRPISTTADAALPQPSAAMASPAEPKPGKN